MYCTGDHLQAHMVALEVFEGLMMHTHTQTHSGTYSCEYNTSLKPCCSDINNGSINDLCVTSLIYTL